MLHSGAHRRDYRRDCGRGSGQLGLINQSLLRIARLTTMLRVSQADISGWE